MSAQAWKVLLALAAGAFTLIAPVVVAFAIVAASGGIPGGKDAPIDLRMALLTELLVGGIAAVPAGVVCRRIAGSRLAPCLLGAGAFLLGAFEGAVLLLVPSFETGMVIAPPPLVIAAPLVAGTGIFLGGLWWNGAGTRTRRPRTGRVNLGA